MKIWKPWELDKCLIFLYQPKADNKKKGSAEWLICVSFWQSVSVGWNVWALTWVQPVQEYFPETLSFKD